MDREQLHQLVHRDPIAAWPDIVTLIDAGQSGLDSRELLEDLIYSDRLPDLIDQIEEQARRSKRFRLALLDSGPALGGRGGPEIERIFKLIDEAEAELATVVEFEYETEIRSPHALVHRARAILSGKQLIFKRRRHPNDRGGR